MKKLVPKNIACALELLEEFVSITKASQLKLFLKKQKNNFFYIVALLIKNTRDSNIVITNKYCLNLLKKRSVQLRKVEAKENIEFRRTFIINHAKFIKRFLSCVVPEVKRHV